MNRITLLLAFAASLLLAPFSAAQTKSKPGNQAKSQQGKPAKVTSLELEVRTGSDDLRGGNDNLNVEIQLKGEVIEVHPNVNNGKRWADNTTEIVTIRLKKPRLLSDIKHIKLTTTFSGGMGGDNWNMDSLWVRAVGKGISQRIATQGSYRFTGEKKELVIPVLSWVYALLLEVETGDDDLRGGDDNLNVRVRYKDYTSEAFSNVNEGKRWGNNTTTYVTLYLGQRSLKGSKTPLQVKDIFEIQLSTNFSGGVDGDNWDMKRLRVKAVGGRGVDRYIGTGGPYRFTGGKGISQTIDVR